MAWKRSILLFGLPLVSSAPANHAAVDSSAIGNWEEVVDSSRAALQEKVQDVFEDARNAIDAMRSNAPATTAAIWDVEREAVIKDQLRKRQDTNTTITSVVDTITVSTSVVTTTPSSSIETPTTSSEPATTQGQSSSSVAESSSPVESPTSATSVETTPSSTSTESVAPTTVTSTSLISVPASTVTPSSGMSSEEQTITVSGQTFTTTVFISSDPSGLPSSSSSLQEQDSSSVVLDPTTAPTTTVTQEITPTTTIVAPTTTAPTTTAAAPTTEQSSAASTSEAQPTSAQTTQAPQTSEARPTTTTNIVVDSDGSIVTSVPPLATATDSEGDTVVLTSPTPGAAFTTEDQSGNVAIVTYTPGGGTVSEVRLRTTTLPNGNLETVTSYATAGAPADPTGEAANSQESDGATLQNGAAGPSTSYSAEIAVLLGAAFGVAGLLL